MTFLASLALLVAAVAGIWAAFWIVGTLLAWIADMTSVEDDWRE